MGVLGRKWHGQHAGIAGCPAQDLQCPRLAENSDTEAQSGVTVARFAASTGRKRPLCQLVRPPSAPQSGRRPRPLLPFRKMKLPQIAAHLALGHSQTSAIVYRSVVVVSFIFSSRSTGSHLSSRCSERVLICSKTLRCTWFHFPIWSKLMKCCFGSGCLIPFVQISTGME